MPYPTARTRPALAEEAARAEDEAERTRRGWLAHGARTRGGATGGGGAFPRPMGRAIARAPGG